MTIAPTFSPRSSERAATHSRKNSNIKSNKNPHLVVQHNYHDHARDPIFDCSEQEKQNLGGVGEKARVSNGLNAFAEMKARSHLSCPSFIFLATPFPVRLYKMLNTLGSNCDVVSWQPHGRCFVVHKPEEFTRMLPKFFKLSKIASFQRQLNLYGFVRLTAGLDKSGYYHERFLRGRPDLLWTIPRAKVKGTKVRAKSNPAAEPNFWNMDWIGTTDTTSPNEQQNKEQIPAVVSSTTPEAAVRTSVAAATAPAMPDPSPSSSTVQQQQQRSQSLSVVSTQGDDFDHHSVSEEEEDEPVDFFDQLLNDMFDSQQAYDFDALQRRLVPQF